MTLPFSDLILVLNSMKHDIKDSQMKFALNVICNFVDKAIELNLGHLFFSSRNSYIIGRGTTAAKDGTGFQFTAYGFDDRA